MDRFGIDPTKLVMHCCKLCGKEMHHTKANILPHLKQVHASMSLRFYKANYLDNADLTEKELGDEKVDDSFFEHCEYTCGICKKKFMCGKGRGGLMTHVSGAHNDITIREYREKYGNSRTKTVKHCCRICKNEILHTKSSISMHLWKHSPLTLAQYKEKYLTVDEGMGGTVPSPSVTFKGEVFESGKFETL